MAYYKILLFLCLISLCSCGSKISRTFVDQIVDKPQHLKASEIVFVEIDEELPEGLLYKGELKFGQFLFIILLYL